jgi:type II secretory pathway component PulF
VAEFHYEAVDNAGAAVTGQVDAPNRRSVIELMAKKNLFVTSLREGAAARVEKKAVEQGKGAASILNRYGSGRITGKDTLAMTAQLSTALRAGLPLLTAIEILAQQQQKPAMKELLAEISISINTGESLSDAMARRTDVFSPLYRSMIRVGETAGILEQTMTQLTALLDRDNKIRTNMKNAAAYPTFVLCLGMAAAAFVITFILPKIIGTISGGVAVLPLPTKMLLGMGELIQGYWWLMIIVTIAAIYYSKKWVGTEEGRLRWDRFKLRVPVLGGVLQSIAVGRFARTFGALTKCGVTILESLEVVRDTLGNEALAREIDAAREKVRTGEPLAGPLAASGRFPPLLVQIVSMGEQTGKLDELLLNAAETFDGEADAAITRFMAIFPAVLILFLALIIGFILAATLLPIIMMELGQGSF